METVNDLVSQLETCVCDDLDTLSAISEGVECDEIIDNIRINLSSRLSELRLLITDKVRIRQMAINQDNNCLLYTSPSPRDRTRSRMPSSA